MRGVATVSAEQLDGPIWEDCGWPDEPDEQPPQLHERSNALPVKLDNYRTRVAERAREMANAANDSRPSGNDHEELRSSAGRSDATTQQAATTYGGDIVTYLGEEEPSHDPAAIYWVDGLIVRDEPGMVLGEPKVGKTLIVEDLALCMAAGLPDFCGRVIYGRPRVLLMTREDSDRTTRSRLWQIARARGIQHTDLAGWLDVDGISPLYFDSKENVGRFRAALERFDVVFIDSLATIHGGDENTVRDMAPVMNAWRDLSLQTKTSLVIVHHLRKPGGDAQKQGGTKALTKSRGSSIIGATTRHAVCISDGPDKNQIKIEIEGNHDGKPDPFVIIRRSGEEATRKWVRHELVGAEQDVRRDAAAQRLDPVVLSIVASVGDGGITLVDLRDALRERGIKAKNGTIDARVQALVLNGKIERRVGDRRIRIREVL